MSRPPRTQLCTIWTPGVDDPFTGLPGANTVRVYRCLSQRGGKQKYSDSMGAEFMPKSTYWVRADELNSGVHSEPKEGELIAKGDHSGVLDPAAAGAEPIKGVIIYDNSKFSELDSYELGTG